MNDELQNGVKEIEALEITEANKADKLKEAMEIAKKD